MQPKTLTRLLAAGALGGMAAVHWLPKKCLLFESSTVSSILLVGLMLGVHRNPLRLLYRDAMKALEKSMKDTEQHAVQLVVDRTAPRTN